jgi:hypothetical protein
VLGFGFHQQNIKLLDIGASGLRPLEMFASVYGMGNENHERILLAISRAVGSSFSPMRFDGTCDTLMHQLRPSIVLASS